MKWGWKKKDKKADEPEELIDDGVDELDDEEWEEYDLEDEEEEQLPRKARILRTIRNSIIAAVVMIVLAAGAGVGYVWYMGENSSPGQAAMAQPVEPVVRKEVKPVQRDPNAPFGASFQMLSTPVVPGSNASATVKTAPEVSCAIVVEINKVPLKDSGLVTRPSDDFGIVTWSWTVPEGTQIGKWPVKVTCTSAAKKSAVVSGDMEVVKTLPED